MLGMEDVRGGRIVDDDSILEIPSDLRQVFDVVALVVVAALSEKSVVHHIVDIKLVQQRVAILQGQVSIFSFAYMMRLLTLDTDAVKTTTSYSSPTLFMNSSTPGRLIT